MSREKNSPCEFPAELPGKLEERRASGRHASSFEGTRNFGTPLNRGDGEIRAGYRYRVKGRSVFFSPPFREDFEVSQVRFAHRRHYFSPPLPHLFSRFITLFHFVFHLGRKRKANESRLINTFVIEARDKRVLREGNVSHLLRTRSHFKQVCIYCFDVHIRFTNL